MPEQPEDETPIEPTYTTEALASPISDPIPETITDPLPEPPPAPVPPRTVAPIWHTVALIALIVGVSIWGAYGQPRLLSPLPVLVHYGASALLEIAIVVWALYGLWLGKTRLRAVFGRFPVGIPAIGREIGVAAIFWVLSMFVLSSVALTWTLVETKIYQSQLKQDAQAEAAQNSEPPSPGHQQSPAKKPPAKHRESPQEKQFEVSRKLMSMAPATISEGLAWGLLCLLVGFAEEFVFRGYLMAQGISVLASIPLGVLFSAVIFGAAHGYEGPRGMVVIGIYGALFSGVALFRRNLFPGMVAHAWHDFATGMFLAFIRSSHLLEKLPNHG